MTPQLYRGVENQNIHIQPHALDFPVHLGRRVLLGKVSIHIVNLNARFPGHSKGFIRPGVRLPAVQDHIGPLSGICQQDGPADAPAGTSDKRGFPFQIKHFLNPS